MVGMAQLLVAEFLARLKGDVCLDSNIVSQENDPGLHDMNGTKLQRAKNPPNPEVESGEHCNLPNQKIKNFLIMEDCPSLKRKTMIRPAKGRKTNLWQKRQLYVCRKLLSVSLFLLKRWGNKEAKSHFQCHSPLQSESFSPWLLQQDEVDTVSQSHH